MKRSVEIALELWVAALVLLELCFRARLVPRLNIHWDEYHFLSQIYDTTRGGVESAAQTFYVRFFLWLLNVPGGEIAQILAGRWIMFVLSVLSTLLIFRLSRLFFSTLSSLFVVLAFHSTSNVIVHGAAFRYDPLLSFVFILSLWMSFAFQRTVVTACLSGVLLGLGAAMNIKTGLLQAWLLLAVMSDNASEPQVKKRTVWLGIQGLSAILVFAACFVSQQRAVAEKVSTSVRPTLPTLAVGFLGGGAPSLGSFVASLTENPVFWVLFFASWPILLKELCRQRQVLSKRLTPVCVFAGGVLILFIYRNAWPYFYVCILPAASLIFGALIEAVVSAASTQRSALLSLLALTCLTFGTGVDHFARLNFDGIADQRSIVEEVHDLFPTPVPYIDRCGMISSFPKVGLFLSSYVLEHYREEGRPIYESLLRNEQPRFLLANAPELERVFAETPGGEEARSLLPDDEAVLRASFVHYLGPIYVPGFELQLEAGEEKTVQVKLSGTYQAKTGCGLSVNGQSISNGESVELSENVAVAATSPGPCRVRFVGMPPELGDPSRIPGGEQIFTY